MCGDFLEFIGFRFAGFVFRDHGHCQWQFCYTRPHRGHMLVENLFVTNYDPVGVECELAWNRKLIFVESFISETVQHITYDPSGVGIALTSFSTDMRPLWGRFCIHRVFFLPTCNPSGVDIALTFFFYRHETPLGSVINDAVFFCNC